jgi:hypothetical protein
MSRRVLTVLWALAWLSACRESPQSQPQLDGTISQDAPDGTEGKQDAPDGTEGKQDAPDGTEGTGADLAPANLEADAGPAAEAVEAADGPAFDGVPSEVTFGEAVTPDVANPPDTMDTGDGQGSGPDGDVTLPDAPPPGLVPKPGDLLVTELMIDPNAVADTLGEWIEIVSLSDQTLDLTSCTLGDLGADAFPLGDSVGASLAMPAGATWVLAVNGDSLHNGGLEASLVVKQTLTNSADQVILACGGVELVKLEWASLSALGAKKGVAASYDPAAPKNPIANQNPANWCGATTLYNATDYGTPGYANSACGKPDTQVDACRLLGPVSASMLAGEAPLLIEALVKNQGDTTATPFNDPFPGLLAECGYGPDASGPDLPAGAWTWLPATGAPGWHDDAATAGYDRYQVSTTAPAAGIYDVAARFSMDGGATWVWCDLDGSENGYAESQAGGLEVTSSPCYPNPCTTPPASGCVGNQVYLYPATGTCAAGDGKAECAYDPTVTECGASFATCQEGACVGGAAPPLAGQVIVTEILFDPEKTGDTTGEWFEVKNLAATAVDLAGCSFSDDAGSTFTIPAEPPLALSPGALGVFARSADPAANGLGPEVAVTYAYGAWPLGNTDDEIALTCGGTLIHELAYDGGFLSQGGAVPGIGKGGHAIQLDPGAMTAAASVLQGNWCDAPIVLLSGDFGTPGKPNPPCPFVEPLDWCRIQGPALVTVEAGASATFAVWVEEAGLTDQSPAVDASPYLVVEVGFGPQGSNPSAGAAGWKFLAGAGDPAWTAGAGEVADPYLGLVTPALPGAYAVVFRASADGGQTWTYCDRDTGVPGEDGSENGLQLQNLPLLDAVTPAVCQPNPCLTPPSASCVGAVATSYPEPAACTQVAGAPECVWTPVETDCASLGGSCQAGSCIDTVPLPAPGEVVISEIMKDSFAVADDHGEWLELTLVADTPRRLNGCLLRDDAGDDAHPIAALKGGAAFLVEEGGIVVLGPTADLVQNGGVPVDYAYGTGGIGLANSIDQVVLECDGKLVDRVAYGASFLTQGGAISALGAAGKALSLGGQAIDPLANDHGKNWCDANSVYGKGDFGTPGAPNPDCPTSTLVDWCRLLAPEALEVNETAAVEVVGRVILSGGTDATAGLDAVPGLLVEAGYGPPGTKPTLSATAWTFIAATGDGAWSDPKSDQYRSSFAAPPAGLYDLAVRASADGGATWRACDLATGVPGEDGSENGYQTKNAGQLTTLPVCEPQPCQTPPSEACLGEVWVTHPAPSCEAKDGGAVCAYPESYFDCAAFGGSCDPTAVACIDLDPLPGAGDLIFTEIMFDPANPQDPDGEWFEVTNVGAGSFNLLGCTLSDGEGELTLTGPLLIAPGEALVFGYSDNQGQTGFAPDAVYGLGGTWAELFVLSQDKDELVLTCPDADQKPQVVDSLAYDTQKGWPSQAGVAIQLDTGVVSGTDNDDPAHWCFAWTPYGGSDLGTPGEPNSGCDHPCVGVLCQTPPAPTCAGDVSTQHQPLGACSLVDGKAVCSYPSTQLDCQAQGGGCDPATGLCEGLYPAPAPGELVITEIMVDPTNPVDPTGEWLEITNLTGQTLNLTGCVLSDGEGKPKLSEPLLLGPQGILVLGFASQPAVTGFVPGVIYGALPGGDKLVLSQTEGDQLTVSCPAGDGTLAIIDTVSFGVGGIWPTHKAGRAIQLGPGATTAGQNDNGASWCNAYLAMPSGDFGTPGKANPVCGDPCVQAVCGNPPADVCQVGSDLLWSYPPQGTCKAVDGLATCLYTPVEVDCLALGGSCVVDGCQGTAPGPAPGELVVSEVMYDPKVAEDPDGEWFELVNVTGTTLNLLGCKLTDGEQGVGGGVMIDAPLIVAPGQALAFAYTDVSATAGFEASFIYGGKAGFGSQISLSNSGDAVILKCPDASGTLVLVDQVAYQTGVPFPTKLAGVAIQLDAGQLNAAVNDGGGVWCAATTSMASGELGTPGAANLPCGLNPCQPNPCGSPPQAACQGDVAVTYPTPGTCTDVDGAPSCAYPAKTIDCVALGGNCAAGACTNLPPQPLVGELIVTEIMFDPKQLGEPQGEWFEVRNVTGHLVTLEGCSFADKTGTVVIDAPILLAPGEYASFGHNDQSTTLGFSPTFLYAGKATGTQIALSNSGDTLTLTCPGAASPIDAVTYTGGVAGRALQLDRLATEVGAQGAVFNDLASHWCSASTLLPKGADFGTPGADNVLCDTTIDVCQLTGGGNNLTLEQCPCPIGAWFSEPPLTLDPPGAALTPLILAEVGYGPQGSDPAQDLLLWDFGVWGSLVTNATATPGERAVQIDIDYAAAGSYDVVARFSRDGGLTWLYCDLDGSTNGYDPAQALKVTVSGN